MSRRSRIIEKKGSSVISEKRFVWVDGEIAEERDETGTVVRKRFYEQGEEERESSGDKSRYFYTRDHLGSIREMVDSTGNVVAKYKYDLWGVQTKESGTKEAEFGYGGYYVHRPSGLYLTWYRQYDPSIARWLSRDPIGEQGGLNLYAYVENNPVLLVDSLGLFAWDGDSPYLPDPNRKPPDWDNTWPTGKDGRGEYSQDPKTGRKYYPHAEDRAHWDHYDYCDEKGKDKRYPDKSIKPRPGQKKLKPNQSADDPWPKACSPSDVVPCHKPYIPIKKPWEHPWWTPPEIKPKTKTLPGTNLPDCCSRM